MSLKSILLTSAVAFVAASGAAQAAPSLNLDGIVVPKNTIGHADGSVVVDLGVGVDSQSSVPDLSVVNVFGRVQAIGVATNPIGDIQPGTTTWQADLLNNGKELTYQLMLTGASVSSPSAGIFDITVSAGQVTYYVDVAGDFDGTGADAADAMDGDVWLVADLITPETFQLDIANGSLTADNDGLLFNAVGGPFLENFDSDQFGVEGADIFTFSLQANSGSFDLSPEGIITGSTSGSTDTVFFAISEPATLGMLGLGLVGMGLVGRRRRA